jgi:biopolymer transport protein ExbB
MILLVQSALPSTAQASHPVQLGTFLESLVRGGPVMIPLGMCSVVLLAWILERSLRLRWKVIGNRSSADQLVTAVRDGGPARALELARTDPTLLSTVFQPLFERWSESRPELEKAIEDSASRDVRGLSSSLRPFSVIAVCAPLLGLLGTVIGIIIAFRDIALSDAMGKPEALAVGIAQALVTTASGLVVAIPAQLAWYWFRSRIDRFGRLVEETGERLLAVRDGRAREAKTEPTPVAPSPTHVPVLAQVAS